MSIKGDAVTLAVVAVVVVAAVWYAKKKMGAALDAVPAVIQDGAEAAWVLAKEGGAILADPLDGFGISPGFWPAAPGAPQVPKWTPTAPVYNQDDKVSNSDIGFNFNLF